MDPLKLSNFYQMALEHKKEHHCGAVPYQHGDLLRDRVITTKAKRILEVGAGIGYSAVCLIAGNTDGTLDTIDKDPDHINLAREIWKELGIKKQIIIYEDYAEAVLPKLTPEYDLIFLDGFVPQLKFLPQFERLLKKGGMLISANLFMSDKEGGRYVKNLKDVNKWQTAIFEDTAISLKLF